MGRFSFVLCYFVLVAIFAAQAVADGISTTTTSTSLAYPRKMMVHRALLIADPPAGVSENESGKGPSSIGEAPSEDMGKEHHHLDKSVAGGGVIIGGLATAIFAAVYCYIRVTRKRDGDH